MPHSTRSQELPRTPPSTYRGLLRVNANIETMTMIRSVFSFQFLLERSKIFEHCNEQSIIAVTSVSPKTITEVTSLSVRDFSQISNVLETFIFILNFSLASRSSHVGEAYTYEIKHGIHPE